METKDTNMKTKLFKFQIKELENRLHFAHPKIEPALLKKWGPLEQLSSSDFDEIVRDLEDFTDALSY